jgi:hypothetical protein
MSDAVLVPDDERDEELAEAWSRDLADEQREARGVEATKFRDAGEWPWRVTVWVMEFVREDPLEDELRRKIDAALRAAPGVTDVAEEDREVWAVAGAPTGGALVAAVAAVVDALADRSRAHIEALG